MVLVKGFIPECTKMLLLFEFGVNQLCPSAAFMMMFEPTCANAWWAHMHCFLSVRYVARPKLLEKNSYLKKQVT